MISTQLFRQTNPLFPLDGSTESDAPTPSNASTQSAHLLGVCGTGMKALAEMLAGLGYRVTGSDIQTRGPVHERLVARGLRIHAGHDNRGLPANVDMVIHSPAIPVSNPELQLAREQKIPVLSYNQMLGRLMETRTGISIAGTHGKSTTTAMVAWVLQSAGRQPSAIVGAELCDPQCSGWAGEGDLFVVESCEYQRNFLELKPDYAAILGIEADHFDCFETIQDNVNAFAEFAARLPHSGSLLLNADCQHSRDVAETTSAAVATFSVLDGSDCDWWASDVRSIHAGMRFRVFNRGDFYSEILLPQFGQHNVINAMAAIGILHTLGLSAAEIRDGLAEFPGIRRRYERIGSWKGVTLIDDYAHHPTALRTTLQAVRQEFGPRRILVAFEPHQVSRTQKLMEEFSTAFQDADRILISPVFAARENVESSVPFNVAVDLAAELNRNGRDAQAVDSLDRMIATLDDEAEPGDVLVTMGAGNINRVHHEFTRRLQRHPATR